MPFPLSACLKWQTILSQDPFSRKDEHTPVSCTNLHPRPYLQFPVVLNCRQVLSLLSLIPCVCWAWAVICMFFCCCCCCCCCPPDRSPATLCVFGAFLVVFTPCENNSFSNWCATSSDANSNFLHDCTGFPIEVNPCKLRPAAIIFLRTVFLFPFIPYAYNVAGEGKSSQNGGT